MRVPQIVDIGRHEQTQGPKSTPWRNEKTQKTTNYKIKINRRFLRLSGAGDLDPDFRRKEYWPRHLEPSSAGVRVWRKS